MTIPYSVTVAGVREQLEEFFSKEYKNGTYFFKPLDMKHGDVCITAKELMALAKVVHGTFYITHPQLKGLVNYFEQMVELLTKLNLPLAWLTPSGLHINQKYVVFYSRKINHYLYKGAKAVTIRIPTTDINVRKQKQGIMPNLIHSLDGAVIAIMVSKIDPYDKINLFTIHDCFATTANHVSIMNELVREAFLEIYSDNDYLNKLHNFLVLYISNNYPVIDQDSKKVVLLDSNKLEIPTPPLGGQYMTTLAKIRRSIYMIH